MSRFPSYQLAVKCLHERALVFNTIGNNAAALEDLRKGISIAQQHANSELQARCLSAQCEVLGSISRFEEMAISAKAALKLYRTLHNRKGEADCLINLGYVYDSTSDHHKAEKFYFKALLKIKHTGYLYGRVVIYNNLGRVYDNLGDFKNAGHFYQVASRISQRSGDLSLRALSLNNIGALNHNIHNYKKALAFYKQASMLHEKTGNLEDLAVVFNNIGNALLKMGEYLGALDYFNKALSIKQVIGNEESVALTLSNIGQLFYILGDYEAGLRSLDRSNEILKKVKNFYVQAYNHIRIARILIAQGLCQKATPYLQDALLLCRRYPRREIVRQIQLTRAWRDLRMNRLRSARAAGRTALSVARESASKIGSAEVMVVIGTVDLVEGKYSHAQQKLHKAYKLMVAHGQEYDVARSLHYYTLGELHSGKKQAALRDAKRCKKIFAKLKLKHWVMKTERVARTCQENQRKNTTFLI
jgi:tetratricopeptide (TPR) repeat protein